MLIEPTLYIFLVPWKLINSDFTDSLVWILIVNVLHEDGGREPVLPLHSGEMSRCRGKNRISHGGFKPGDPH